MIGVELNQTIQSVIKNYYSNVDDAIRLEQDALRFASLKERTSQEQRFGCPAAVFVRACKNGDKPERTVLQDVVAEEVKMM